MHTLFVAGLAAVISVFLAGPSGAGETVKAAHVPLMNFAPLYVAIEKGYFRDQDIHVELERVKAGVEAMAFLASGQIDVGAVGMSAGAFDAFHRQMDLKIVATAAAQPLRERPVYILVRKDLWEKGQVRRVGDLKGRKVAVAGGPGSAGGVFRGQGPARFRNGRERCGDCEPGERRHSARAGKGRGGCWVGRQSVRDDGPE